MINRPSPSHYNFQEIVCLMFSLACKLDSKKFCDDFRFSELLLRRPNLLLTNDTIALLLLLLLLCPALTSLSRLTSLPRDWRPSTRLELTRQPVLL